MAPQLSTVSSWALAAPPLPTVPQPQVIQSRESVDLSRCLVCVPFSVSWSALASSSHVCSSALLFHMAVDQPDLLAVARSLGIMSYK